jgi:hypothetical protein
MAAMSKPVLGPLPPIRPARRSRCKAGRHVAEPVRTTDATGLLRSRCRFCGADLVQMIGRAWIVSGRLG